MHRVRVRSRQELDVWLKSNINPDQTTGRRVYVVCPDKTAKDSSVVAELQARGCHFYIQEWDHDSQDDPRAMWYWLNCNLTNAVGCLEMLHENEIFAKDKCFQMAFKNAKEAVPMMYKLLAKIKELTA